MSTSDSLRSLIRASRTSRTPRRGEPGTVGRARDENARVGVARERLASERARRTRPAANCPRLPVFVHARASALGSTALEAEAGFLSPNQRSRGHALRRRPPPLGPVSESFSPPPARLLVTSPAPLPSPPCPPFQPTLAFGWPDLQSRPRDGSAWLVRSSSEAPVTARR